MRVCVCALYGWRVRLDAGVCAGVCHLRVLVSRQPWWPHDGAAAPLRVQRRLRWLLRGAPVQNVQRTEPHAHHDPHSGLLPVHCVHHLLHGEPVRVALCTCCCTVVASTPALCAGAHGSLLGRARALRSRLAPCLRCLCCGLVCQRLWCSSERSLGKQPRRDRCSRCLCGSVLIRGARCAATARMR